MSRGIAESDWKAFRTLHAVAMDRFFQRAAQEMQALLEAEGPPAQERFWDALNLATERRELAAILFDGPSRSTVHVMLIGMVRRHLVTEQEMAVFTPETRDRILELARSL